MTDEPLPPEDPRQRWRTPAPWREFLNRRYGPIDLDAAAESDGGAVCATYYTREIDGLKQPWARVTFCNPPFDDLEAWVKKLIHEVWIAKRCETCIFVAPTRTDRHWWAIAERYAAHWYDPEGRIDYDPPPAIDPKTGEPIEPSSNREASRVWIFERRRNAKDATCM